MNHTRLTSDQAEALIAGSVRGEDMQDLAAILDSVRTYEAFDLDDALVDRIVAAATFRVSDSIFDSPTASTGRARGRSVSKRSIRHQIATIAAVVALVFASGTSVVYAADGASPGDALYGLDRALENVGIGDGGTPERLSEVEDLVAKGEVARGLEHAAVAIAAVSDDADASRGQQAASAALELAAQRARESESGQAGTTKEGVAALLAYLADNIGHVDGTVVAELAQDIGKGPSDSETPAPGQSNRDSGSPPSNPGNAPDEPPGQSNKDSGSPPSNPGNAPDEPPGQSDASQPEPESSSPGNAPDEPPGQSNKNSGAQPSDRGNAPDEPPGQSKKNSGNSSKPEKTK